LYGHFTKQSDEVIARFITVLEETNNHRAVLALRPMANDDRTPQASTMEPSSSATAQNEPKSSEMDQAGDTQIITTQPSQVLNSD
jgi:hypothetical protein